MTQNHTTKTHQQVTAEFRAAGINVSEWARVNGFHRMTVLQLMSGKLQGRWGETHRCAVALGLKAGTVVKVADFKPAPAAVAPPGRTKRPSAGARQAAAAQAVAA